MRFVLVLTYDEVHPPLDRWPAEAHAVHTEHVGALAEELHGTGELVQRQELAPPTTGRLVAGDGRNPPVVRDWPYDDGGHPIAAYWVVEVDAEERALEIAGRLSAAPGPRGPLRRPVEVRRTAAGPLA